MARLQRITLPRIGKRVPLKEGFSYQVIWMSAGGTLEREGPVGYRYETVPTDVIQRGYVKLWRNGVVVDRALTVKAARRRMQQILEEENQ